MRCDYSYLVCFVCLLSSCYVPHPVKPHLISPNLWTVKDRNIKSGDNKNLPYLAWWHNFHDPNLNKLMAKGLKCNNTLNVSRANVEAAVGELKRVKYQWIPTLDARAGYSRNPAMGFPGLTMVLIPSYVINLFKQIREQQYATYTLAEAKAEDDGVRLTVISEIATSYFTYLAEIEREKLYVTLLRDTNKLAKISKKVYFGGLTSNIPPQDSYSQASKVQGQLDVVKQNVIFSRNAIRYLINENPGEIKSKFKFSQLDNKIIPGSLPLTVLENRPDLQVAGYQLRASAVNIGLASSNILQTLTFDLIGGLAAGESRYILPQRSIYYNDQLADIPLIKLTVLGDIEKAKGLNKAAYYHYIDTLQKALRNTTDAIAANKYLTLKLKETEDSQKYLAKAYKFNEQLYRRGIQDYVTTLYSKVILDQVNIRLNEDKLRQLLTIVYLYQEMAGGYKSVV